MKTYNLIACPNCDQPIWVWRGTGYRTWEMAHLGNRTGWAMVQPTSDNPWLHVVHDWGMNGIYGKWKQETPSIVINNMIIPKKVYPEQVAMKRLKKVLGI